MGNQSTQIKIYNAKTLNLMTSISSALVSTPRLELPVAPNTLLSLEVSPPVHVKPMSFMVEVEPLSSPIPPPTEVLYDWSDDEDDEMPVYQKHKKIDVDDLKDIDKENYGIHFDEDLVQTEQIEGPEIKITPEEGNHILFLCAMVCIPALLALSSTIRGNKPSMRAQR